MSLVRRLARPALAAIFINGGLGHFKALDYHVQAGKEVLDPATKTIKDTTGVDVTPDMLVKAQGATMVGAGTLFALGKMPRLSSLALAGSLVAPTLVGHAFWKETDPQARQNQQTQFLKNLGLIGGALLGSVDTAGKPGLAYRAASATKLAKREAAAAAKAAKLEAKLAAKSIA